MGAFLSASDHGGHSSHPEHCARFNHVDGDSPPAPAPCRMCKLTVDFTTPAYRCSEPGGCAVVLHDACYRRPTTLKRHFGHPQHLLTLGGAGVSCSLCALPLDTPTVGYSCAADSSRCAGFRAHPRCCHLPKSMTTPPDLHEHTKLLLRPPSSSSSSAPSVGTNGRPLRRTCLRCGKTAKAAPWSYQCPKCAGVEYCLACVLGNGDRAVRCCCLPACCDVDPAAVSCAGCLAGVFFCAFLSGMGCPGSIPAQLHPGDMELEPTRKYRR